MLWTVVILALLAAAIIWRVALFAMLWAVIYFFTHLGIVTWVTTHPWQTVLYASGYLLVGAAWSVAKWWFAETNRVRRAKEEFKAGYGGRRTWEEYAKEHKTDVARHKRDLCFYIAFWPLNGAYTLLNDPVRRAARRIYDELQGVYQRITDRVWQ